mgnify:CR=1 FL=1
MEKKTLKKHIKYEKTKYLSRVDVEDIIQNRKSIRKFKDTKVPKDLVNKVIDAARLAPSGCNIQPTRIVILKSVEEIQELKDKSVFLQEWAYKAPVILVFCGNAKAYEKTEWEAIQETDGTFIEEKDETHMYPSRHLERFYRDIGISSAFSVLQAEELGLGSCYIGLLNREKLKEELKLPEDYIIPFALAIGYPDDKREKKAKLKLDEIILEEV